jgi:DNA repair exonuclease SbcCD ATPase subunit
MIRLKTLRIRNFLSFESGDFDFQKAGLYLISGWNQKEGDSNGAGKSAIMNAICFALYGRTSTGLTKDQVRRWGTTKPMSVELTLTEGAEVYVITRTDDSTTFTISGKPAEGYKKDIQSAINDTFKTSYDIFINSTMFSLNRSDPLAASTDAEKKKLFKPIFQLERIDKAYDKAKTKYDSTSSKLDELNRDLKYDEGDLKDARSQLVIYTDKSRNFSNEKDKSVKELKDKIASLTPTPIEEDRALVDLQSEVYAIDKEYQSLLPLVDSWRLTLSALQERKLLAKMKWEEGSALLEEMNTLEGRANCRLCGERLTKANVEKHRKEIMDGQAKLLIEYNMLEKEITGVDGKIKEFLEVESRLHKYQDKLESYTFDRNLRQASEEMNEQRIRDLQSQIRKIAFSENPYDEMVSKCTNKIELLEIETGDHREMINSLSKDADVYSFLKWVLSKEGVSSFIIERAFGRLESLANRYLSLISTEGFQLEIKPQKELKSKAIKEEIDIVVKTGSQRAPYWALSGGQRQRLNISMLLAIYTLVKDLGVNRFGFLLLDEVLDLSLDDKGQESIINLLRRLLGGEVHNIFVISHKDEIASNFDYNISVTRSKEGVSKVD